MVNYTEGLNHMNNEDFRHITKVKKKTVLHMDANQASIHHLVCAQPNNKKKDDA
jgi:hypothetical protein